MDPVGRHVGRRVELAPGDRFVEGQETLFDVELVGEGRKADGVGIDSADHRHAVNAGEVVELVLCHHARSENE